MTWTAFAILAMFLNQAGFLSSISLVSFTKKAIQGHKVSRPSTNLSEWSQGHKVTRSQEGRAPTYQSGHIPRVGVVAEVKKSGGLVQKSCKTDVMRIFLPFEDLILEVLQTNVMRSLFRPFQDLITLWIF